MTVARIAGGLLAGVCLGSATACDDGGPTRPTPVETMIAPESIIGRTATVTIRETRTRCTAPPGTVIHYHFADAETLRAIRTDGLFDGPARDWSYTRTGARAAEIEITWERDGRSEVELAYTAEDRGTFEQRDFATPDEVYCGDVTRLDYRGDFELQDGAMLE